MESRRPALRRHLGLLARILMGLALVTLPFTSFPLFARLVMRGATVAPISAAFIFLLAVGWLPVYLWRGGKLPAETGPFLGFLAAALVASAAAFFLPFPPNKGQTLLGTELRALITLAIGSATYLVCLLWHRSADRLAFALRMVNLGGLLVLVWSFVQLYFVLFQDGNYPAPLRAIQGLLSTRSLTDPGFRDRVGGFSYEPSWLAHQLNVLYLPYWLAATLTGYSAARKFRRLSLENALLAAGCVVLYFTASRIGFLAFLLVLAFCAFQATARLIGWLEGRLLARRPGSLSGRSSRTRVLLSLAFGLAYAGFLAGLLILLPLVNPRFEGLFAWQEYGTDIFEFGFTVGIAERVVHWSLGWNVFARYPLLGVGLGNAGYFFEQFMPNVSYRLPEIMTLVNFSANPANIKSLWLRLPAETGLVGFSLFAAWQYVLWQAARFLRSQRAALLRAIGWMGAFVLVAFLAEGFSVDSFALPYVWVSAGLLTAAAALGRAASVEEAAFPME